MFDNNDRCTYQLAVEALISNGKTKQGTLNFYVVQDKVQHVKCTRFKITEQSSNASFLKNVETNGAEVYVGNNQWENVKSLSPSDGEINFEVESNIRIPAFSNQIFMRAKGNNNQLKNYEFIYTPQQECQMIDNPNRK